MDLLSFIANIIESLAWPLAVVFIAFLFRHSLTKLIPGLKSLKYKGVELEFDRQLKEAKKELSESISLLPENLRQQQKISKPKVTTRYYRSLAEVSPRAAILEAWIDFEVTANTVINKIQPNQKGESISMSQLFSKLEEAGLLSTSEVEALTKLRALRNQIVHGPEPDLSIDTVNEYASMLSNITDNLKKE